MENRIIAFVMYEGLTALDLIGPLTTLGRLGDPYQAVTVAEHTDAMPVSGGLLQMAATHRFDDISSPYCVIVPGGGMPTIRAMANRKIHAFLKPAAEQATIVGSVCTGSLILAATGLLEGRQATTHWGYRPELEKLGATYVRQRWVEDGKFITAAGVSAGIDMGLYLAARLTSEEQAKNIQLGIEYDPAPPFGGIDWTGVDEQVIPPEQWSDNQKAMFREALAEMPELYEKLIS